MGLLDKLGRAAVAFSEAPADELPADAEATPDEVTRLIGSSAAALLASRVGRDVAMQIPAMRRARNVICATIATWPLMFEDAQGVTLSPNDSRVAWLQQPEEDRPRMSTFAWTLDDLLWKDRAVWRITDKFIGSSLPAQVERIAPGRWETIPDPLDPSRVAKWIINGRDYGTGIGLVTFDGAGIGGLERTGFVLDLSAKMLAAAGRYADAPAPTQLIKNKGADLSDDEADELIDQYTEARNRSGVAYVNAVTEVETMNGWSAKELQLVEGREQGATEIARATNLPAIALDASSGDSMTYSNRVQLRQEIVEAIRPFSTVIEQTLMLTSRQGSRVSGRFLPYGIKVRFDTEAYVRDDPETRMRTWESAARSGILSVPEMRSREPFATDERII